MNQMPSLTSSKNSNDSDIMSESLTTPSSADASPSLEEVVNFRKPIEVVATRRGFYDNQRKTEGESFTIKNFDEIGEWMKCVDSQLEKKRLEFFKQKKAKK